MNFQVTFGQKQILSAKSQINNLSTSKEKVNIDKQRFSFMSRGKMMNAYSFEKGRVEMTVFSIHEK